jgi:adenylyltransferase/sulfurtransferase
VGTIHVADHDVIDITNIHRQFLYSPVLVGEKKALVARQKLAEMNPFIYVEAHDVFVHAGNVEALLEGIHLVLDCTDNMRTKFLLHDACFLHRIPLVSASVYKYVGQVRSFDPATGLGCLRCSTAETPSDSLIGNCNDFGVLGASVGVVGNIQAGEAIAFLLNRTNATLSETLYLDLKALTQMKVRNGKREGCASCSGNLPLERDDFEIDSDILNDDFEIVDIRTVSEDMLSQYVTSSRKVAVLCDRGIRSLRAVKALRAKGHSHFFSVRGGASAVLK